MSTGRGDGTAVSTAFTLWGGLGGAVGRCGCAARTKLWGWVYSFKKWSEEIVWFFFFPRFFTFCCPISPYFSVFSAPPPLPTTSRPWEQHWVPHRALSLFPPKGCSLNTDQQRFINVTFHKRVCGA